MEVAEAIPKNQNKLKLQTWKCQVYSKPPKDMYWISIYNHLEKKCIDGSTIYHWHLQISLTWDSLFFAPIN